MSNNKPIDRLQAIREQRAREAGQNQYGSAPTPARNPYDQRDDGPYGGGGGGGGYDGYGQQNNGYNNQSQYGGQFNNNSYQQPSYAGQGNAYELSQVEKYGAPQGGSDMDAFRDEIDSIKKEIDNFSSSVDQISRLHGSLLSNVEPGNSRESQQLESMIEASRAQSNRLLERIKALQRQPVTERQANERKPLLQLVKDRFMTAVQKYQREEYEYREKYKQRMERQFRIVNPNATEEEVRDVVNGNQDVQIFAQAAMGNRYGNAQGVYREVQERAEAVRKIEKTMAELAQLFQDLSILVQQQDDDVNYVSENVNKANEHIEQGRINTDSALKSAISHRKGRIICFCITLVILAVIGIIVGIEVSKNINNNKDNNNSGNSNNSSSSSA